MRAIIALLIFAPPIFGLPILAAAPGFAAENRNSLPVFFFRNTIGFRNDISANSGSSFIAETPEMRVAFRPDSVTFQVHGQSMLLRFPGSDANVQIEGSETIPGKVNFLLGQKADRWQTGVELYHRVLYRCLYPGIDLQYTGIGKRIKSEFLVSPAANPKLIRLAYPTAGRIRVDSNGDLVVSVAGAELREYAPDIFQDSADGGRVRIDGRYRLLGHRTAGFEIGAYDTSRPLIIDPVVTYCTYLSGSLMGAATGAATDGSGNLYVTGWTEALDFPVSVAAQSVHRG